ncbi:MAG: GIY-YIG nuclease family protein [Syntrophales bacterium]|jgi:putative endonuclease|nr:GIY-YIG nuclease family protein [Syntrophales bacterium]MCK9527126.1 GIY-YIG nuclease family protein [Syntrophales bacterium]MDX9921749.1 GIY-YIG nuclease family protein [Syntrophales bacterium]
MEQTWYVYIIRRADGCLYTGISTDPHRRRVEHERGGGRGSRYLRGRGPLELVFIRTAGTRSAAMKLERTIKNLSRAAKLSLISGSSITEPPVDTGE